ncbi:MAG: hypothetical protein A2W26_08690 [Acidobacteria bacterium RBG_16_64_8]|nr:MAG: hypothetical protein A2W26_08690 [Acidobacteria bacterium RBG_16_64_8]
MGVLKVPSRRLARQVFREVSFEDRFEGYILRERAGARLVPMYRLEELVAFLNDRHPRLDFEDLEAWVRNIMDDTELADHIRGALSEAESDQSRCEAVRGLLEERLGQCREASGRNDGEA